MSRPGAARLSSCRLFLLAIQLSRSRLGLHLDALALGLAARLDGGVVGGFVVRRPGVHVVVGIRQRRIVLLVRVPVEQERRLDAQRGEHRLGALHEAPTALLEDAGDPSLERGRVRVRVSLGRGQAPGQRALARELDVALVAELVGAAVDDPRGVGSYPKKIQQGETPTRDEITGTSFSTHRPVSPGSNAFCMSRKKDSHLELD